MHIQVCGFLALATTCERLWALHNLPWIGLGGRTSNVLTLFALGHSGCLVCSLPGPRSVDVENPHLSEQHAASMDAPASYPRPALYL